MMAIVTWTVVAFAVFVSAVASTATGTGYRVILWSCVAIGLTPLGFIANPGIPLSLAELILLALAVSVCVNCYRSVPMVRISLFEITFGCFFLLQTMIVFFGPNVGIADVIRDIRPIAFVLLLLIISSVLSQSSTRHRVKESHLLAIIIGCILFDLLYYAATFFGALSAGGISGEFYLRTGLLRYSDLLTISLFGVANYFVYMNRSNPARSFVWLTVCAAISALSMNRVFALGFLLAFSWWLFTVVKSKTKLPIVPVLGALAPLFVLAVVGMSVANSSAETGEAVERIREIFDMSLLLNALSYRFVEPAFVGGYEYSLYSVLFGAGIGFKFYVPWFEYRGLDPWHFSVDSLFAFAFFKYGIVGLMIWILAMIRLLWQRPWNIANAWIWLYLLVHSGVNVPGFLLFLVILVILRDGSWIESADNSRIDIREMELAGSHLPIEARQDSR